MRLRNSLLLLLFFAGFGTLFSQKTNAPKKEIYIQFSGVVLDQDSMLPIPFVSILVNDRGRTVSDYYGFFTVIASPGDEIKFLAITHKTRSYKIADTTTSRYMSVIQVLTRDTIELAPVEVYPWPSKEEFKRQFLALDLNETDYDRADKNMNQQALTYIERNMTISGSEAYKNVQQNYYTRVYTMGQQPQIQLLNPIAWAQFIDSWRKKNKPDNKKPKVINKLNED